ncbi:hypothetical protein CPB83DRAFT_788406 [Crepidotus variabilis]|uniref:Uncharacterized protein n=1 Tax=Crepidotus variabilis TaxID=179855 RepID=A0A9P6EJU4_9AGAR|nr:hypothetical protein CPB83DRAFT_788406 [Crepidotus variabilis]
MSTEAKSNLDPQKTGDLLPPQDSTAPLAAVNPPPIPSSPNHWEDVSAKKEETAPTPSAPKVPPVLDASLLEEPEFRGLKVDTPTPRHDVSKEEVLNEFDPLVSQEEQAAREAWAEAESHPPPPPRTPSPPVPPVKDLYIASPTSPDVPTTIMSPGPSATAITSPTPFSSFTSFAKSFAIPLVKPRPHSLDGSAKAVPSPTTLSSFAKQQQAPKSEPTDSGRVTPAGASTPPQANDSSSSSSTEGVFDFQRFLDQMKTKSAEPVSRYLRSFLSNFAKRTFTVNDQVKIIADFLSFIAAQMRECDVWRNVSDAEFDNAMEGIEKLVMNRLYDFTFTPQLAHANPPRPITTDDLERDRVLSQRIALFGWIEEEHLDVPEGEGSKGFMMFAQQELIKINHYKAPRDKLICILNSCKVIFGLIRHLHKEEGADSFLPILIFVVLKANPEHLLSNVEFINRFRNPSKLQSEAGYYLSSLMGAVSFIETMDHTSLSCITQDEFEKNVELAIQALPPSEPTSPNTPFAETNIRGVPEVTSPHAGEESARPLAISTPAQPVTISEDAKRLLQKTGDTISKPLSAIGRIFTEALDGAETKLSYLPGPFAPFELGREGRQEGSVSGGSGQHRPPPLNWDSHPDTPRSAGPPQTPYNHEGPYSAPIQTPYKPRIRKSPAASPAGSFYGYGPDETPSRPGPHTNQPLALGPSQPMFHSQQPQSALLPPRVQSLSLGDASHISRTPTPALDFAGVQAQIDSAHEQAASASKATLKQIFPGVDDEVIDWVLEANDGDLGRSIEQLLEIGGSPS